MSYKSCWLGDWYTLAHLYLFFNILYTDGVTLETLFMPFNVQRIVINRAFALVRRRRPPHATEQVAAVFMVSPTYEGACSDVTSAAEACHGAGVPLVVDEAHGAHLAFLGGGAPPRPPSSRSSEGEEEEEEEGGRNEQGMSDSSYPWGEWRDVFLRLARRIQMYRRCGCGLVFVRHTVTAGCKGNGCACAVVACPSIG